MVKQPHRRINNNITWVAPTAVAGLAVTGAAATANEPLPAALTLLAGVAGALALRFRNARAARAEQSETITAQFPQERVERLIETLDRRTLDELAVRLAVFEGDDAALKALVRRYEWEAGIH